MRYKGYTANVRFVPDDRAFHGTIAGTRDTIHFTGTTVDELEGAFHDSVDDYLEWCAEDGREPDRPYSGKIALRTSPDTHRAMMEAASGEGVSLNHWIDDVLSGAVRRYHHND